ncbi:hypothetical protein [Streptomyces sp. NPDC091268]|uniref:hypothetical protein n=1 Tax=Streptomyces sp. NPDC091268 TaxID=3365979 RepID=UPI00380312EB
MTWTAEDHRGSRRLAWCVALLLRHAPDHVADDLLDRLDWPTRKYLCRDEWLPASAVTLLIRRDREGDRHFIARNPHVVGRPLPGLPGPARYARRRTPPELLPVLRAELGRDPADGPLTGAEQALLLRRHGRHRPRVPLDILALPHEADPDLLRAEHAREPLPPGAVEALLLRGDLPLDACRALLDLSAPGAPGPGPVYGPAESGPAYGAPGPGPAYGPSWYRPAVRAVRMGLLTHAELVDAVRPARLALLLADLPAGRGLRWTLPELAGLHGALRRALAPLEQDPRLWAELLRHAPAFPGSLPDLVARLGSASLPAPPARPPAGSRLERAVARLAPTAEEPAPDVERELALASLAVPMESVREDIRWVRDCLDRGLLTGADVVRHKLPACWALDEDHWLGDIDHPDRHDRPAAVLAARAEADRLLALALGEDPDAWWRAARTLPDFAGTLPHLLLRVTDGGSVSERP